MSQDSDEAAALAKLEAEERAIAIKAMEASEAKKALLQKTLARKEKEEEIARIAKLTAEEAARKAAESTPNPEKTAKPESKPKPELKESPYSLVERRKAPTPMTTEQVVQVVNAVKLEIQELKKELRLEVNKTVDYGVSRLYWKMFPVLCMLMIVIGTAAFSIYLVSKENRKGYNEMNAGNLKGYSDLIEKIGNWTKKLGKTQILVQAPTMAPSKAINPEKKKSVVIANYKATGSLEVFEVKLEGGKLINRSIGVIDHGARQVSYDGDETRLLVVGDVGPDGRTEPKDFKNGLWIWTFDDDANKGGLATQDSAFLPK